MPEKRYLLIILFILTSGMFIFARTAAAAGSDNLKKADEEHPLATLTIIAVNSEGPAYGNVELSILGSDEKWRVFLARPLVRGRAVFEVPPGTYRAIVTSTGEMVAESHSTDPLEIKAGDEITKKVYFKRGRITVVALDKDRDKIDGALRLDMYDPGAGKYRTVPANILVVDGRAVIYLAPGKYRVRFTPEGIIGAQEQASGVFEVRDKSDLDFQPKIEYGILKVSSGDYEGPLKSRITILTRPDRDGGAGGSLVHSRD
ncbi:MAG: hypothetical protein DRP79_09685, partial [Planctomycetota bacterium]